jgi:hypothetical protein
VILVRVSAMCEVPLVTMAFSLLLTEEYMTIVGGAGRYSQAVRAPGYFRRVPLRQFGRFTQTHLLGQIYRWGPFDFGWTQ